MLTATGLAGVIGYGVTQRLPEIAIRMALGADGARVVALVMRDGLAIVMAGLVVGFGVSFAATRLISKLLFQVVGERRRDVHRRGRGHPRHRDRCLPGAVAPCAAH